MPDDLSAALEPIRERLRATQPAHKFKDIDASQADVPVLLAALDKILKRADEWDAEARPSSALEEDRMWIRQECADMLRETILAELTGKEIRDE